jgi:hypothetical protein
MFLTNWLRSRSTQKSQRHIAKPRTRLGLQQLEAREVPAANFLSAIAVTADTFPDAVMALDSAVDAAGNSYVTGNFLGTIDFDPAVAHSDGSDVLTAHGTYDVYVAKYAPDNSLAWVRRMGSEYTYVASTGQPFLCEWGWGIAVDGAGNAYVSGNVAGAADFGPFTLANAGMSDAFLTKIDTNGNFLWAKGWGGATREFGNHIAVDAGGNVFQVGFTTTSVNGGWIANGFEIRKYSSAGALAWNKHVDNRGGTAYGVTTDAAGNVYVSGNFTGTVDFNPDPAKKAVANATGSLTAWSGAGVNAYVLKLSGTGTFNWVAPFVAKTAETPDAYVSLDDLAVDPAGNIIAGGEYRGQVDVNPSTSVDQRLPYTYPETGNPWPNGVVVKLTSAGGLVWANPMVGGRVNAVAVDGAGAVYATGTFYTSFSPGPGSPTVAGNESGTAFVAKLTTSGAVAWSVTLGGSGKSDGYGIAVDAVGTVSVYGRCSAAIDLDPDPTGEYLLDNARPSAFLLKLSQN